MAITSGQTTALNFQKFFSAIEPYLSGAPHAGYTPVGTVISVMGNTAPPNYLVCDGEVYNINDYPELATYFEQQFEAKNYFGGDGVTTFAVPDLRGEFLRGTGTNSHENQGSGAEVGEHQDATLLSNYWTYNNNIYVSQGASTGTVQNADYSSGTAKRNSVGGTADTTGNSANFTSRPTNTSVLYCIAVKNIFIDTHDMADTVDAEDVADMIADNPPVARDNFQKYATYEQVVGEWIDGKPLYQKTVVVENLPSTMNSWVTVYSLPVECVIVNYISVMCTGASQGEWLMLPFIGGSTTFAEVQFFDNTIKIFQSGNSSTFGGRTLRVTIQYTKTTD